MKIFIRTLSVVLIASMINCSKSSSIVNISIAGTWTFTTQTTAGCANASNNYIQTFVCPATTNNTCFSVTFNSNGSFTTTSSSVINGSTTTSNGSGSYLISGNKITITTGGSAAEADTFVLSGNTLTITTPKDATSGCTTTIAMTK